MDEPYLDADHFDDLCKQYNTIYTDYLTKFGIMEKFIRETMQRHGLTDHLLYHAKPSSLHDRMILSVRWNMVYPYLFGEKEYDSEECLAYETLYGAELSVTCSGFVTNHTINACYTYRDADNILAAEHKDVPILKCNKLVQPAWFIDGVKGIVASNIKTQKQIAKRTQAPPSRGIIQRVKSKIGLG